MNVLKVLKALVTTCDYILATKISLCLCGVGNEGVLKTFISAVTKRVIIGRKVLIRKAKSLASKITFIEVPFYACLKTT